MAQGRSTKIMSMIQWILTSRLSIKNALSSHEFATSHPDQSTQLWNLPHTGGHESSSHTVSNSMVPTPSPIVRPIDR